MSVQDSMLNECGCCEGIKPLTPASLKNRPGLSALVYRVGTHGSFKKSMQSALSKQSALHGLTTRSDDDPSMAVLDGWSTVLDVLSFYQERIANEGFLRTATERRSLLELARSIGYELRPGVAAGTYLAFTLETAPGAPLEATIAIGTKAQTIPGQDELPQMFETVEEIKAKGAWNDLKPKQIESDPPGLDGTTIYLKGTSTHLKPGDALLVVGKERMEDPGNENWDFRRVKTVDTDTDPDNTMVIFDRKLGSIFPHVEPAKQNPKVYALRQRANLFGYDAPDWRTMPDSVKVEYITPGGLYAEYFDNKDLTYRKVTRIDPVVNFEWGTGSPDPLIESNTFSARWTGFVRSMVSGVYTFYTSSDDGVRLWVDGKLIIDNWTDHGTKLDSGTITLAAENVYPIVLEFYENGVNATIKLLWSRPGQSQEIIPAHRLYPMPPDEWPGFAITTIGTNDVYLDAIYSQIIKDSWLVLSSPNYQELYQVEAVVEDFRADYTLTAKTTRATLIGENLGIFDRKLRQTVVFAQSEELPMAKQSTLKEVSGNSIVLDREIEGLTQGQLMIVSGTKSKTDEFVSEVVILDHTQPEDVSKKLFFTKLFFTTALKNTYQRDSVIINANVVRATHGETKTEVLGSGDGSQSFQKFVLKQTPLTYVSSATPSGTKTTLEVRVNELLWKEVPTLYGVLPEERVYITRIADDGKVTVQFGDNVTGARLPTGVENVKATYRVGTGLGGMVDAGQISLLMTRPLGVRGVINPLAPTGADDPEARDDARQNAPLTVLTLDRIVSLQDFEDFARAFAGIGKAQATLLWNGERRMVHITVAAANGGVVDRNSDLYENLIAGIDAVRHPEQPIRVDSYKSLTFDMKAKVLVRADAIAKNILANVKATLIAAFSFKKRLFGQAVTKSEVVAVMQKVSGVVAVDLDQFYLSTQNAALNDRLPVHIARWNQNNIYPSELLLAELLLVSETGIKLTEMTK